MTPWTMSSGASIDSDHKALCIMFRAKRLYFSNKLNRNAWVDNWSMIITTGHHYTDVIMGTMASQIISLTIFYSIVYSGADKKTSKLHVAGLCVGISPGTCKFPAQMASNAENISIGWRHHDCLMVIAVATILVPCRVVRSLQLLKQLGRVAHICACNLTIIGWYNGILLIRPLWTNFSGIFIEINSFAFNKTHLKMSSAKRRPFCLGLNVLKTA